MTISDKINAALLANTMHLKLDSLLPTMPLIAGFKSEIISFGYVQSNFRLIYDQIIYIGSDRFVIPAGEFKLTLALMFKNRSVLALSTLRRSWLTTINGKCIADFDATEFFHSIVGKTLTIDSLSKDLNTERTRFYRDIKGQELSRTDCDFTYKITII